MTQVFTISRAGIMVELTTAPDDTVTATLTRRFPTDDAALAWARQILALPPTRQMEAA